MKIKNIDAAQRCLRYDARNGIDFLETLETENEEIITYMTEIYAGCVEITE